MPLKSTSQLKVVKVVTYLFASALLGRPHKIVSLWAFPNTDAEVTKLVRYQEVLEFFGIIIILVCSE